MTEYSWGSNVWKPICHITDLQRIDCCFEVQALHVGVPIDGLADVFCDNRGVMKNASIPESTLMKKHNAINYHAVWEAVAAGILCVGEEDSETNLEDLLMKVLSGEKHWNICWHIMW
jgi:hypothetical protein